MCIFLGIYCNNPNTDRSGSRICKSKWIWFTLCWLNINEQKSKYYEVKCLKWFSGSRVAYLMIYSGIFIFLIKTLSNLLLGCNCQSHYFDNGLVIQRNIITTNTISMLRYQRNFKYSFMFSHNNAAWKGLILIKIVRITQRNSTINQDLERGKWQAYYDILLAVT